MYRIESFLEIIQTYNKDAVGGSLDPVLKDTIVTLNNDLVNFRKTLCQSRSRRQGEPYPSSYTGYVKSKKQYEEDKSENINKGKRIPSVEEEITRLKVRLSDNGTDNRSGSHHGSSHRGGSDRDVGCDYDSDRDHDRWSVGEILRRSCRRTGMTSVHAGSQPFSNHDHTDTYTYLR